MTEKPRFTSAGAFDIVTDLMKIFIIGLFVVYLPNEPVTPTFQYLRAGVLTVMFVIVGIPVMRRVLITGYGRITVIEG